MPLQVVEEPDVFHLVLEHAGVPLASLAREMGPLPWPVLLPLAIQLFRALAWLHSGAVRIAHRDVKPGNMFVSADMTGALKLGCVMPPPPGRRCCWVVVDAVRHRAIRDRARSGCRSLDLD